MSGTEEERLIYHDFAHITNGSDKYLVVDIGGGSTELVTCDIQCGKLEELKMEGLTLECALFFS
ncbi:hypothetical protein FD729_04435 [Pantoea sp. Nvir]|nr:hypothetical protein [Pantoea sp. Nvir]CAJ0992598.1 Guanosine-5'-triphosphate,3'-diphosphate pyrophosphatase [Pantoea sp. Nvir]